MCTLSSRMVSKKKKKRIVSKACPGSTTTVLFLFSQACSCMLVVAPTGVPSSISAPGSWRAPAGSAGCAGPQTAPDTPARGSKEEEKQSFSTNPFSTLSAQRLISCTPFWILNPICDLCIMTTLLLLSSFCSP